MQFIQLIAQDIPVIIDFHAEWCGPCKMMAPMLEKVKEEFDDKIKIYKIDIDKNRTLADKYQVQAVPTLMIFRKGKLQWRVSGVPSMHELKTHINSSIGQPV
ncbi:MAG: thioredoxin [Saprospiraceae bacterium]|jgi:thioredoxin 1|nr:thioredoxin [Saprospiraceae bacterium]MBK6480441.1 thioredoxin [Saprospiraceae bacterium]MBK6817187.1 thioredoxin [Saprospiraceae bacterium]MBK7371738.1 thioredoxin [Saprospiraceae bacterium]MBK7435785.1 thioredoxin [Saprospiraceae bacterium]